VKNIGLGSPGAAYLPSKGHKAPKIGKIGKMSLKMGNIRLYLVITTKIKVDLELGLYKQTD
jgi:hypothetical protein